MNQQESLGWAPVNTTVSARAGSDINPQRWLSLAALCVLTGLVWLGSDKRLFGSSLARQH